MSDVAEGLVILKRVPDIGLNEDMYVLVKCKYGRGFDFLGEMENRIFDRFEDYFNSGWNMELSNPQTYYTDILDELIEDEILETYIILPIQRTLLIIDEDGQIQDFDF
jgi:hypothetical protein